jgi:hypothetical protein
MSITTAGVVKNGVVVPDTPLPEGAQVRIHIDDAAPARPVQRQDGMPAGAHTGGPPAEAAAGPARRLTPTELRRLPREQRQAILAAAAELAEEDYRSDKELTGFEAFSEEEMDDAETDSR